MLRIERTIRKTASRGLKTLIRLENQPKDLLTEENLKVILRPILICLQQQHQIFNIPFLNVLRKLVKYLNQCFNRTLSDKLAEHLTKVISISFYLYLKRISLWKSCVEILEEIKVLNQ